MEQSGRIIFLNGATSSGKTSIARALQARLPEPYLHVSLDNFVAMLPDRYLGWSPLQDLSPQQDRAFISGLHHSIAALADSGNNLIVDHVLLDHPRRLAECVTLLAGLHVLFVGVFCPLAELERRERERKERPNGLARRQVERIHGPLYDITVDTATADPEACAARIIAALRDACMPTAFERYRLSPSLLEEGAL